MVIGVFLVFISPRPQLEGNTKSESYAMLKVVLVGLRHCTARSPEPEIKGLVVSATNPYSYKLTIVLSLFVLAAMNGI